MERAGAVKLSQKQGNRELYNEPEVAGAYAASQALQPAEEAILVRLGEARLAGLEVLDIGVGAGRTTARLAPRVRKYVGLDIAQSMVDLCRERFPGAEFLVADAENLWNFADASFDFVLFSFNGIDCLAAMGRDNALLEMQRVLRPGGFMAFSSHNVNFIPGGRDRSLAPPPPGARVRNALRFLRRARSVRYLSGRDTALVVERHFGHSIELFFATPDWQVRALRAMGWRNIRAFGGDSGREFDAEQRDGDFRAICDPWVYYFCEK